MTEIWAHRGFHKTHPENSFESVVAAVELGLDGVEVDVQMTEDGVVILHHDENLLRLTGTTRYIKDITLSELGGLSLNDSETSLVYKIPSLEEVLQYLSDKSIKLNIEFKTRRFEYKGIEEKTIRLVAKYDMANRVYYSSFSARSCRLLAELGVGKMTGYLYANRFSDKLAFARAIGVNNLHPKYSAVKNGRLSDVIENTPHRLHVWTVNKKRKIRNLLEQKVHAIITDRPVRAMRLRDEYLSSKRVF